MCGVVWCGSRFDTDLALRWWWRKVQVSSDAKSSFHCHLFTPLVIDFLLKTSHVISSIHVASLRCGVIVLRRDLTLHNKILSKDSHKYIFTHISIYTYIME